MKHIRIAPAIGQASVVINQALYHIRKIDELFLICSQERGRDFIVFSDRIPRGCGGILEAIAE